MIEISALIRAIHVVQTQFRIRDLAAVDAGHVEFEQEVFDRGYFTLVVCGRA